MKNTGKAHLQGIEETSRVQYVKVRPVRESDSYFDTVAHGTGEGSAEYSLSMLQRPSVLHVLYITFSK